MTSDWHDIFEYRDGHLYWKVKPQAAVNAGDKAGTPKGDYLIISYKKRRTPVHRVIWEMHNGAIPDGMFIDHINRNATDNSIENLRLATQKLNNRNRGGKGYSIARNGRYVAGITVNGKRKHLGTFDTPEEARACWVEAKRIYHGVEL